MNIFVLDSDPVLAAQSLCDRHVSKMILESAQMLSSVADRWNHPALYKVTHKNHPCTLWAGDNIENWNWLIEHSLAMETEKLKRTGKGHKSADVIRFYRDRGFGPPNVQSQLTPFALAMPDKYRNSDPVEAYRSYYLGEKQYFKDGRRPVWSNKSPPEWWRYQ